MHMDPLLPAIVAAVTGILLVGVVLRRLRQPHVVAYLVAGVLLGPHGFGVFEQGEALARVGDVGVVLLLFFLGMELPMSSFAASGRVAVLGTLLQILATVACVAAVGAWLHWPTPRIVLLGFALSLSSTALVVSLLRARGEVDTSVGRDALGILLAQDMAIVPMVIVIGLLAGEGFDLARLATQLAVGGAVVALVVWVVRHERFSLPFGRLLSEDHELAVFGSFLICFGCALVTALAGLSTALGAFVAGVIVAEARETDWVHRSLEPYRVLLVALFFVSVGMLLDVTFLREHAAILGVLVLATFVANTLVNYAVLRLLGRTARDSLMVGALLAQIGEFSFVLAALGRSMGIITDYGYQTTLSVIAITLLLSPPWIALVRWRTRAAAA